MKIRITESELKEYIKGIVQEAMNEGAWADAAKNLGKETMNKVSAGAQKVKGWAKGVANSLIPGNKELAEQDFMYILISRNLNLPDLVSHPEAIENLKKQYPKTWARCAAKYGLK